MGCLKLLGAGQMESKISNFSIAEDSKQGSFREIPEFIIINREEELEVFLNDEEVLLNNNKTEGALRSFCLHKHTRKLTDR